MIYLNYAALCPTRPEATQAVEATMRAFNALLYSPAGLRWYEQTIAACRQAVACFLGVRDGTKIAFVPNASLAAHLILSLTEWKAGDMILTSTHENPSVMREIHCLVHRGVRILIVDPTSSHDLLMAIERCLTTRSVKAILLSHVSHIDGRILPITEIGALARRHGASFYIDGAQAVGQIPVNLESQAFDIYFFPGHKWCRGPLGTGALAVHPRFLERHPTFTASLHTQAPGSRFEIGTHHIGLIAGLAAACEAVRQHGPDQASLIHHRAAVTIALEGISALRLPDWDGPFAPGMVTVAYRKPAGKEPLGVYLNAHHSLVVKEFRDYPANFCPAIRVSWIGDTPSSSISSLLNGVREYFLLA